MEQEETEEVSALPHKVAGPVADQRILCPPGKKTAQRPRTVYAQGNQGQHALRYNQHKQLTPRPNERNSLPVNHRV